MKTDELIELLGNRIEPVRSGQLPNTLVLALVVGTVGAFCVMIALFGFPTGGRPYSVETMAALAFPFALLLIGLPSLIRSARPGEPGRKSLVVIGLVFLAMLLAGAATLVVSPPMARTGMLFGPQWLACLICIPLFALPPFAALFWALRSAAPTHPAWTGSAVGLVAAAVGAVIFSCCAPSASLAFVALWYVGLILLCALIGAIAGHRFLRW